MTVRFQIEIARVTGHGRRCGVLALVLAAGLVLSDSASSSAPEATGGTTVPACQTELRPKRMDVPGIAAAIVKDGRLVCMAVAGVANIEADAPVTPDTLFLVASVSKTITVTALMQLYEKGLFGLDDDVNDYLPFAIRIPAFPSSPVTFRQLLTHTASIDDNGLLLDELVESGRDSPIPLRDFVESYFTPTGHFYDEGENFESSLPGTVSSYANMGIVLIGYLVEVLSEMPFDEYCQKNIFEPLGMTTTTWRLASADRSLLAMPYINSWLPGRFSAYGQYGEPNYPDGMLRTSIAGLSKFLLAYMGGGTYDGQQILGPDAVDMILSNQTSLDPVQGLVWYRDTIGGRTVWGHNGSDLGARAEMWFAPDENVGVIMVSNGDWDHSRRVVRQLLQEAEEY